MTQLSLEAMPARLFACTPSRLMTWLDCPRRYRMTYLERPQPPKGPPWAHNSLGAAVHTALAGWWRLDLPHRTAAAAGDLLEHGWLSDGFRDATQSTRWRRRARSMVEGYVSTLDPQAEPVGVERTVATRTKRLALSGRADRIDQRGDCLVVVDYKTGRTAPTPEAARSSLALAVYAVAASHTLRRACVRVELHHLPTGTVATADHTPDSLARHVTRAESIAEDARAAEAWWRSADHDPAQADTVFPAQPGSLCGWCDFRRHCPAGQAAAPARDPWAALDADQGR